MKSLEEIERLSLEDLERISADSNVKVPEGLKAKVATRLVAFECREQAKRARLRLRCAFAAASLAAAFALAALVIFPQTPKDTYDDPELARAELEKTFAYISGKIDKGLDLAEESVPIVEKPFEMISRIKK